MSGCCEHDNEPSGYTKCGELPSYYANFRALTAAFQNDSSRRGRDVTSLTSREYKLPTYSSAKGSNPNLVRLSSFMSISWRISGHSVAAIHSLYLNPYARTSYTTTNKQQQQANLYSVTSRTSLTLEACYRFCRSMFTYVFLRWYVIPSVRARACVLCIHVKDTSGNALISDWGVQRSPLLTTGQRKPSVSLLFPRIVFAFQIIMIIEGSVQTRWIQANRKKTFRFRNSRRLACFIS